MYKHAYINIYIYISFEPKHATAGKPTLGPYSKVVSAVAATEKEEMMAGGTRNNGKIPLCFRYVEFIVSKVQNSRDRKPVYFA